MEMGVPTKPVHLYVRQEAAHIADMDTVAKVIDIRRIMTEVFGKSTGTNHGKRGPLRIADFKVGMLRVNPIVGSGPTHAVDAAPTSKGEYLAW